MNALIISFAGNVAHLPEVKLDKLIYIAHLYHYANFAEILTDTRFFSLAYGPHAPGIRSASRKLLDSNSIFLTESRTSSDPVYSNPCLIMKARDPGHSDKHLSSTLLKTLREVFENWGDKPYERILGYTARTIPYLSTRYRESIDWNLIRPYSGLKHALPRAEQVRIHRFVERPEAPFDDSGGPTRACFLSVNDIAEIYLALCGGHPDGIPPREHLGFDLQSVLDSLDKPAGGNETGSGRYPAEIENAAQLAHSLVDSLSFRSFSARVALKAGMFFLRNLGYSFDETILEEHWPDRNSYEVLEEWFGRVSKGKRTVNEFLCGIPDEHRCPGAGIRRQRS